MYHSTNGVGTLGSRNARPRWEVHERCEGRGAGWRHHAAFERRRDALVFLDTTAAASGGESVTTAPARRRETPEPSQEPPQSSPRRTPKGPIWIEHSEKAVLNFPNLLHCRQTGSQRRLLFIE